MFRGCPRGNKCQYVLPFYDGVMFQRMDTPHPVCSFITCGPLGCSHCLTLVNRVAVNIHIRAVVWPCFFSFLLGAYLGVALLAKW